MNDQDEMFEAATETPAFLGCPQHMPKQLPSGFDGTEPAKRLQGREKPLDPTAPEMKRGEGRLFKNKHNSSCHGTYIYDRICINDAHIRATLHPDNGGLEQHATIWIGDSQRCFCYCTFNTTSTVKCDYVVRGMLAGLAKRLVYHHKNLIKRKAKWAAAKQQAHDNKGDAGEVK